MFVVETSSVIRPKRYELDISEEQVCHLNNYFGADRWVHNYLLELARTTDYLKKGDKLKSVFDMAQLIRHLEGEEYEWITNGSGINYSLVHYAVTKFKQNYEQYLIKSEEYKDRNEGKEKYNPNKFELDFKRKSSDTQSFGISNDGKRTGVRITKEGYADVRFTEEQGRQILKTKKPIKIPQELIQMVVVKKVGNRFYLYVYYKRQVKEIKYKEGSKVGIDLGVKQPLTLHNGQDSWSKGLPKGIENADKNVKSIQSKLDKRFKVGSNKWLEYKARYENNQERKSNRKKDFHYKTARELLDNYETIKIDLMPDHWRDGMSDEESEVSNKINHKYALLGIQGFLTILEAGADETNNDIVYIAREATTKTCSVCNFKNKKLPVTQRTFECINCGHIEDRDFNSAKNVYHWVVTDENRVDKRGRKINKKPKYKSNKSNPTSFTGYKGSKTTI